MKNLAFLLICTLFSANTDISTQIETNLYKALGTAKTRLAQPGNRILYEFETPEKNLLEKVRIANNTIDKTLNQVGIDGELTNFKNFRAFYRKWETPFVKVETSYTISKQPKKDTELSTIQIFVEKK